MSLVRLTFWMALCVGSAAAADPLADMEGSWRGSGWAREIQEGPKETVRCQINNSYDGVTLTLKLSGRCAVPGRKLTISGTLTGSKESEQITGRWSNPDGIGSVRVSGYQREGVVVFAFDTKDPSTGRDLAQNVEWRLSEGQLRLRSVDRNDPSLKISDISFKQ